jgi:hypothetical protein
MWDRRLAGTAGIVWLYLLLSLAGSTVGLARSSGLWSRPVAGVAVTALVVAVPVAVVVRRSRAAWGISVLAFGVGAVSPLWDATRLLAYVYGLVMLALLVSPAVRRHVGAVRRRNGRDLTSPDAAE